MNRSRKPSRGRSPGFGLATASVLARLSLLLTFALGLSGAVAAQSTAERLTGTAWVEETEARAAAARSAASLIRQAHDRISAALLTAKDQTALATLKGDLTSAFGSAERALYADLGITARLCGDWLVTYATGDGSGDWGWLSAGEVQGAGELDRIGPGNSIESWGRPDLPASDLPGCTLTPVDAPAVVSRYRAPAEEERDSRDSEWRTVACPAGQVGAGITERRHITTTIDGHGHAINTDEGPWTESARNCRVPRCHFITQPHACEDAFGNAAGGVQVREYEVCERPGADGQVDLHVDWTDFGIVLDFCAAGPAEEVEVAVTTEAQIESPPPGCQTVHGADWDLGSVQRWRCQYTTTTTFPASWNRAPEVDITHDRWSRILPLLPNRPGYGGQCLDPNGVISAQQRADTGADDCAHRNITMNNDDGGCGGTYESWTMHTFVDPRPHQADYEVPGTRQTQQQPPCPPPPSGGGGGDNGGETGYRDQHGNTHRSQRDCSSCGHMDQVTDQSSFDSFTDDG